MSNKQTSIEIYGADVVCASCVNAPSSKDTYEWLQAAIDRKYPNQPYDITTLISIQILQMKNTKKLRSKYKMMNFSIHSS